MPNPSPLPFEYRIDWKNVPVEDPDAFRRVMDQRDRELEDFLARHLPAAAGDGSARAAYIKYGLDYDASLPGFVPGDGVLDETYTGVWPVEYTVHVIGGESPIVEIEVPEDGVYHVSSEYLIILDAPATENYQVHTYLGNNQSAWLDPFGRTHQEDIIITGTTHVDGSMAGMFSMEAGDRFFLNAPTLTPTGSEFLDSGVFTFAVAWYCSTSPPVS